MKRDLCKVVDIEQQHKARLLGESAIEQHRWVERYRESYE